MPMPSETNSGDMIWAMSLRLTQPAGPARRSLSLYAFPFLTLRGLGSGGARQADARSSQAAALIWPGARFFVWPAQRKTQEQKPPKTATSAAQNKPDTATTLVNNPQPSQARDSAAFVFMHLKGGGNKRRGSPPARILAAAQNIITQSFSQTNTLTALAAPRAKMPVKHPGPTRGTVAEKNDRPSLPRIEMRGHTPASSPQRDTPKLSGHSGVKPSAFTPLSARTLPAGPALTASRPVTGGLPFSASFNPIQRDAAGFLSLRPVLAIFPLRVRGPEPRASHSDSLSLPSSRPTIQADAARPAGPNTAESIPPPDLILPSFERPLFETMVPKRALRSFGATDDREKMSRTADALPTESPQTLPGNVDRWNVIIRTIEQRISREVAIAVKKTDRPKSRQEAPHPQSHSRPLVDLNDEGTVTRLLQKMRRADRQERFRSGGLR